MRGETKLAHVSSHHVIEHICDISRHTYAYNQLRPGRSCSSADMQIPPITELEEAAKKLVWAAKKDGTLKFVHKISNHDNI